MALEKPGKLEEFVRLHSEMPDHEICEIHDVNRDLYVFSGLL